MNKQNTCKSSGCEIHQTFGFLGQVPKYCSQHGDAGMINFKQCGHIGCTNSAIVGYYGQQPEYCKLHESAGMIEI